jgi:hypothetical protein
MKIVTAGVAVVSVLLLSIIMGWTGERGNRSAKWDFEQDSTNASPAGFTFAKTGSGRAGRWIVQAQKRVPSGSHVLAQVDTDSTNYRFPVAVANDPVVRDLRLSVRCKPVTGKVDQACGLAFRYRDDNNYYVVRANALENNVRLYFVKNGNRQQFADWNGRVSSGQWHDLRVDAMGNRFEVFWDGQNIITARDSTFTEAGKIGLWTKADSLTYFDDLIVDGRNGR